MMAVFTSLMSLLKLVNTKIYLGLLVVAIILGSHFLAYSYGKSVEANRYERLLAEEYNRGKAIINRIEAETRKKIEAKEAENAKLEEQLKANDKEAERDPSSNRPALSRNSVQRLNKIRSTAP